MKLARKVLNGDYGNVSVNSAEDVLDDIMNDKDYLSFVRSDDFSKVFLSVVEMIKKTIEN